jgi:hypothetical protein
MKGAERPEGAHSGLPPAGHIRAVTAPCQAPEIDLCYYITINIVYQGICLKKKIENINQEICAADKVSGL